MSDIKETLLEIIIRNFLEIKRKKKRKKKKRNNHSSDFSINSISINASIKEIKETKNEKNEENLEEECNEDSLVDKEKTAVNGGYGTVSKQYGISPIVKYINYDKIWGHLGNFRTYSMYRDTDYANSIAMQNGESTREMVSTETIEKAARHFKYFVLGDVMGDIGFVPPFGINISSKEWEKYRLMTQMSIYQPLLKLKSATA